MNPIFNSFLKGTLGSYEGCQPLAGDASTRSYFRVSSGAESFIACIDPPFKGKETKDYPFFIVYGLFQEIGIPVPRVLAQDNHHGFLLLEDLGDGLLEKHLENLDIISLENIYKKIIQTMIRYQLYNGPKDLLPYQLRFDREKLYFEFDFFMENALLSNPGSHPEKKIFPELKSCFEKIAAKLDLRELMVLNHRDLHCRNIMELRQNFYLIDFQDARMGLPQYDLASLLKDSYFSLPKDQIQVLVNYCYDSLKDAGYQRQSREEFFHYFQVMAFQRNIKALGTFYFQLRKKKNDRYLGAIHRTKEYLKNDYLSGPNNVPEIAEVVCLLENFLNANS